MSYEEVQKSTREGPHASYQSTELRKAYTGNDCTARGAFAGDLLDAKILQIWKAVQEGREDIVDAFIHFVNVD